MASMPPAPKQPVKPDPSDRNLSPWELALRATGARLCYGEPVEADGRTVIPVASVEAAGGGGWGSADAGQESSESDDPDEPGQSKGQGAGGGLGGWVSATPVGFIEIGPEGTR